MSAAAGQRARDAVYDIGVDVLKLTSVAGVLRGFLLLAALCGGILAIAAAASWHRPPAPGRIGSTTTDRVGSPPAFPISGTLDGVGLPGSGPLFGGVGKMARQSILDRSNPNQTTVELFVDWTSGGEPFYEAVPVDPLGGERFRVLASPGLLDGLATGDVFERRPDGSFEVIERSGNLAVQIWYPDEDLSGRVEAELVPGVRALGGWLDGQTPRGSVFTFPLRAGFPKIEKLLDGWLATAPAARWSYANVYDADGWTPLRWWETEPFRDQLAAAVDKASRSES